MPDSSCHYSNLIRRNLLAKRPTCNRRSFFYIYGRSFWTTLSGDIENTRRILSPVSVLFCLG
jgi:hypothetical protein